MQQRPTGIAVGGMQSNLQQQQQQRMMRPNVPANPGLRHLLQQVFKSFVATTNNNPSEHQAT